MPHPITLRHVRRSWRLRDGLLLEVSVASVDEKFAQQAGTGDMLLLKGHSWPENYGGLNQGFNL